ncbi:MAG: hypothetical protein JJV97_05905 [SAR324 cluster bacterium]|nr:hypothetical protein [SAR324 cluster bacterium]
MIATYLKFKAILLANKSISILLALWLVLSLTAHSNIYSQPRRLNVRENKIGFLVQAIPQKITIISNQVTGEKKSASYVAIGVELLYERVIDDSFSYGVSFSSWMPPKISLKVPYSQVIVAPPFLSVVHLPAENYEIDISQTKAGFFMKTYLSPNRTKGVKIFVQSGIGFLSSSVKMSEKTNKKKYDFSSLIITKHVAMGMTYNFRNGVGLQANLRYMAGFSTNEFASVNKDNKKYASIFTDNTILAEFGILFGF